MVSWACRSVLETGGSEVQNLFFLWVLNTNLGGLAKSRGWTSWDRRLCMVLVLCVWLFNTVLQGVLCKLLHRVQ